MDGQKQTAKGVGAAIVRIMFHPKLSCEFGIKRANGTTEYVKTKAEQNPIGWVVLGLLALQIALLFVTVLPLWVRLLPIIIVGVLAILALICVLNVGRMAKWLAKQKQKQEEQNGTKNT